MLNPFFQYLYCTVECSKDWGGRGYDGSAPEKVTKTTPSGDRTT